MIDEEMEESIHEKKAMPGSFPADAGDLRHGVGRSCRLEL
jgi:hypothetical protein